jgi:hypothetical protein
MEDRGTQEKNLQGSSFFLRTGSQHKEEPYNRPAKKQYNSSLWSHL